MRKEEGRGFSDLCIQGFPFPHEGDVRVKIEGSSPAQELPLLKGKMKSKAEFTSGYAFAAPPPGNRVLRVGSLHSTEFSDRRPLIRSLGIHGGMVILPAIILQKDLQDS